MPLLKPLNSQLLFVFFRILVFFLCQESLDVIVCERYGFFNVLAAIIRESCDMRPWIEIGDGFTVHSLTRPRARKASDVSEADWRHQRHVKKYRIFSRVYSFLQGQKSLYNNVVYMIKTIKHGVFERCSSMPSSPKYVDEFNGAKFPTCLCSLN